MTRACNPGGGIKLFVGIGLWSFQSCASLGPKIKGVFPRIVGFCRTECVRCWSVYIGRGHREVKIPLCSVTHSSVRGGRRRSCWLIRATRVLWRHTKSHEPRWSIGSGMLLYSLSPLSAFLIVQILVLFSFFPLSVVIYFPCSNYQ